MDVGIPLGGFHHVVENLFSFRIVGRPPAGEDELHGGDLPDQLVRADHPDRVLEPVEPGDLHEQGPFPVDSEFRANAVLPMSRRRMA